MRKVQFIGNNGSPLKAVNQQRNAKCACNSGKKAKHCCGTATYYKYTGTAAQKVLQEQENENSSAAEKKDPWLT